MSASKSKKSSASGASIPSDAGHAVGMRADDYFSFAGVITDHSSVSYDQSTPSTVQTAAGQAVGMRTNDYTIAEDHDESLLCDEPKADDQTLISADTDNLRWDCEPGRGGVNDDAASLEVSAITSVGVGSAYTLPPDPGKMNKLHFSSLGLHGRQNEIHLLRGCFDRFVTKLAESEMPSSVSDSSGAKSSEVVIISGESGTGKVR